jgi:hypothetical protein
VKVAIDGSQEEAVTPWYDLKQFISQGIDVSTDACHVVAGVILQLLFVWISRRGLRGSLPWAAVLAIGLINEAGDLAALRWPSLASQLGEGFKDILLTMLLPTVLLCLARRKPEVFTASG